MRDMIYNLISIYYFIREVIMNFNGKVVVITGASHGIGLATLKKFWELGAQVVNIDRNDEIFGADLFFKGDVADEMFLTERASFRLFP